MTTFAWLWRGYLSVHGRWLTLALVLMVIEGASLAVFASQMEPMFDRVFVNRESAALLSVGLTIMVVFVVRAATSVGQRMILSRIREVSAAALRLDLLRHIMRLDGAFHAEHPPGTLIERVQGDVQAVNQVWTGIVTGLGRDLVSVVALFAVAISVDWWWTVVALVGVPFIAAPSLMLQGYVRTRARAAREVAARMSTRLDEVFHGITPVKLNGLEADQAEKYAHLGRARVSAEVRTATGQAAIPGLIDVMTGIGFLCVMLAAGPEIVRGDKSVGQFMTFFTAMSLTFEPIRRLGNLSGLWQAAVPSIERMRAILDWPVRLTSPAAPVPVPEGPPRIEMRDVSLAYGGQPVLRGLNLVAEAGQTTALVGASGAGKTTVFNVLTRLVDADAGEVTVGGVPVGGLDLGGAAGAVLGCQSGGAVVRREPAREHPLGRGRGQRGGAERGAGGSACGRVSALGRGAGGAGGRARVGPVGRPAAAGGDCPRGAAGPPYPAAGRGDKRAGHPVRGAGARGAGPAERRADDAGHRAPPVDGAGSGQDCGHGGRPRRGRGHA